MVKEVLEKENLNFSDSCNTLREINVVNTTCAINVHEK